jgi:hypothetical protein
MQLMRVHCVTTYFCNFLIRMKRFFSLALMNDFAFVHIYQFPWTQHIIIIIIFNFLFVFLLDLWTHNKPLKCIVIAINFRDGKIIALRKAGGRFSLFMQILAPFVIFFVPLLMIWYQAQNKYLMSCGHRKNLYKVHNYELSKNIFAKEAKKINQC